MFIRGFVGSDTLKILEFFIFITIRSIVNPGIATEFTGYSLIFKWLTIFILSFVILLKPYNSYKKILNVIYIYFIAYGIYLIVASFIVSSFPLVASLKVISFLLPFLSILKGVFIIDDNNLIEIITEPLSVLIFSSFLLIDSSTGYLRNGHAFQGAFNHPNAFGVILALYLAGFFYSSKKIGIREVIVSTIVIILAILTKSRTGIFSIVTTIFLFLLSKHTRKNSNAIIYLFLFSIIFLLIIAFKDIILMELKKIIFKTGDTSILYSRVNQIENGLTRFKLSPFFGTGFNVPYVENFRTYDFSFKQVVENGNLVLGILADTGIIGLSLFSICYLKLFRLGSGNMILIFAISFIVSMGEMFIFSTNNFAIILYFYISIYVIDGINIRMKNVSNKVL